MSEFDGIIKFMQSPTGRMIFNALKDVAVNHVIPHYRNSVTRPVDMSEEEMKKKAKEEFQTVDDFDLQHEPK